MDIQKLQTLAAGDESLLRSLSWGFFRSQSAEDLASALTTAPFDKPFCNWRFRCFTETASQAEFDRLAKFFLPLLGTELDYKKRRTLAFYLDRLYEGCGIDVKTEIARTFLQSGRRYLRKYVYAKKLDDLGEAVTLLAQACCTQYSEEATFFFHTVAYRYGNDYVESNFDLILENHTLEEYQIRKLFIRKIRLLDRHWDWLERNHPSSMIYVAAIRNHELTDSTCLGLCKDILRKKLEQNPLTYEFREIERIDGLLMWCLARMHKWAVIRKLLANAREVRKFKPILSRAESKP
jgi:hypothetical protein